MGVFKFRVEVEYLLLQQFDIMQTTHILCDFDYIVIAYYEDGKTHKECCDYLVQVKYTLDRIIKKMKKYEEAT